MAETGRPFGATEYSQEYPTMLVLHMATGYSYESFAGLIGVSAQTLYNWEKRYEAFFEAKKEAFTKCLYFWEKLALENINSRDFKVALWAYNMKCRFRQFGWNEDIPNNASAEEIAEIVIRQREAIKRSKRPVLSE